MGSQKVRYDSATKHSTAHIYFRTQHTYTNVLVKRQLEPHACFCIQTTMKCFTWVEIYEKTPNKYMVENKYIK